MRKASIATQETAQNRIKVRLDSRTNIVISKMSSLRIWKQRYPDAKVIS